MEIREVTDKKTWETFLLQERSFPAPFFQSWNWGEVQERLGNNIYRLGMFSGAKLTGAGLLVEVRAKRGHYLHLRHGPVLTDFNSQFDSFLPAVLEKAKALSASFVRMSPLLSSETYDMSFLRKRGLRNAPIHNMDAENTLVLDLAQSEEAILSGMRKTTRYLVRKSQTMPISVGTSVSEKDFKEFLDLYEATAHRHKFVPHRGMSEELSIFSKDDQALLFLARYKKKVIAAALIIFYGSQAIYHHAATDDTFRDIPAAYLLQWEIIKEAKRRGKKQYNFWGVVPEEKPNHPWKGLTLFKTGFGGQRVNAIHAQDLPLSLNYRKSYIIETLWRIRRGY